MANNRGVKLPNSYLPVFGPLYDKTPKAVFAAVALSLAYRGVEEAGWPQAVAHFLNEWRVLHANGIVPQRPPKESA